LRTEGGVAERLPVERWLGAATAADEAILDRAIGPVLDVGCGPGRHVHALARRGVLAIGLDICPSAVEIARRRGATAVEGSVFRDVPGAGTWGTVLLLDGNLGIGGSPVALLLRSAELLRAGGRVLAELDPPGTPSGRVLARLERPEGLSDWFTWARVAADGAGPLARSAGLAVVENFSTGGRLFSVMERPA